MQAIFGLAVAGHALVVAASVGPASAQESGGIKHASVALHEYRPFEHTQTVEGYVCPQQLSVP